MTDKQAKAEIKRIQGLLKQWIPALELDRYNIKTDYIKTPPEGDDKNNYSLSAEVNTLWEYQDARIAFYLPNTIDYDLVDLQNVIVHELSHILVAPMRDKGKKMEELAVTNITNALIGAVTYFAKRAKS